MLSKASPRRQSGLILNWAPRSGFFLKEKTENGSRKTGLAIFIKNLEAIDNKALHQMFSAFGNILSCKIAVDGSAQSKGYGFVQYDTEEAAQKAIDKLNGMLLNDKSVYVGAFVRKQERDMSSDKAQFSQLRPIAIAPSVAPRMPMYLPGGPGLGQQIFYGQGPPAIMPPQPGFGYQQQLVPGMRPGGGGMPNFFVPMVQQGQRPGGRRGGAGPLQQPQQPIPLMPQQVLPRGGRMYRYPPGRNMQEGPMPGVDGGMLSIPYDMAGIPMKKLF